MEELFNAVMKSTSKDNIEECKKEGKTCLNNSVWLLHWLSEGAEGELGVERS